jgi:hypothetical protein
MVVRDHSAFLNSYAIQDEGLYDDAQTRGILARGNFIHQRGRWDSSCHGEYIKWHGFNGAA